MKKHLILAAVAALATFTACSNEENEALTDCTPVNFTIQNVVTRATTSTDNKTTFEDSDIIGITSKGLYEDFTDQNFTVSSGSATLTPPEDLNPQFIGTRQGTFYAYYPTNSVNTGVTADGSKVAITVASDQSEVGAYQKNDLMTSTATGSTSSSTVNFTFEHKLCLVKVDPSGLNVNVTSVTINNVKPTATWTYGGSVVTSGDATSIKMGKYNESSNEYWAIIPAQEIAAGKLISVVTDENKIYSYTTTSTTAFTANNVYKYTLGFNLKQLTANVTLETAWGEETNNGNTTVERELRELIPEASIGEGQTFLGGNWDAVAEGWDKANTNANVTLFDDTYAKIVSTNTQWWTSCITYRTSSNLGDVRGLYELKIVARGDGTNADQTMKLLVLAPALKGAKHTGDETNFGNPIFAISEAGGSTPAASTSGKAFTVTASESTYVFRVDLKKVCDTKNYSQDADANTFSSGLVVAIAATLPSAESPSSAFYVRSISMKEIDE